ncbi:MAG TPA: hypothetical protein VFN32_08670 [Rhodococcus sp. (in: high G+C Gram-positive bacteria)]|nr:hypothetical protein [Rhodococcus sp. (in: high G+C Gram-positive bacteria)]
MTKNRAVKDAARRYQAEHPGTTFPEAMRIVTRGRPPGEITQWWSRLSFDSRSWLVDHNGEPLSPEVKEEIMAVNGGRTSPSWWNGDSSDGLSELTDEAVDWIEEIANDEG